MLDLKRFDTPFFRGLCLLAVSGIAFAAGVKMAKEGSRYGTGLGLEAGIAATLGVQMLMRAGLGDKVRELLAAPTVPGNDEGVKNGEGA